MKRLLCISSLAAAAFIIGLWVIAVPDSLLVSMIENSVKAGDMQVEVSDLKKGVFYNFSAGHIRLKKSGVNLLEVDELAVKLDPMSVFMLRLTLDFTGEISGGKVRGRADVLGGRRHMEISLDGSEAGGVPLLSSLGLEGKGSVTGRLSLEGGIGEILFTVKDCGFKAASFGGITVPLELFSMARGAMTVREGVISVKSFTMEGDGVFARITGDVRGRKMNLTMEIMPEKTFVERNPLLMLLRSYQDSPGHYVLPVKKDIPL